VKYPSDEMSLSVIIPVHNGGGKFRRCLASLKESTSQAVEIIVVADGDTDGSYELAKRFGARVFRLPSPRGPGRARNFGASRAQGEVLFFIDADVMVPPQLIGKVRHAFKGEPEIDALFGSYDDEPSEPNFLSQYRNLLHHYVHQHGRENASTFWAGCGAIRRDIFMSIGGFDESYTRPSIEDIELGYRLKKAGYRIKLCKSLQVKHLKRWNLVSMLQADFFQRALPWTQVILRERNLINDLNTSMSGRASVVLTCILIGLLFFSWSEPIALVGVGAVAGILFILNAPLYRFFVKKRGYVFAFQALLWHWLYFLYSGVAFVIGMVQFVASPKRIRIFFSYLTDRTKTIESERR
jgi:glycosyltransferase involved in cell wall biosynthesis